MMLSQVEAMRDQLRPSERKLADYVLESPREVLDLSMTEVANRAGVSQPTIARFCRALGFSGFREFKIRLAQGVAAGVPAVYRDVRPDEPVPGVAAKVLDRTNGQWLWSKQTVYQNVVSAIDPKTGVKTINQAAVPHIGQTTTNCPADPGSRGWPATAYSPRTHMLYIPLNEYCSDTTPVPIEEGKTYTGGSRAIFARGQVPNSDGKIGRMDGVDLFTQKAVWSDRTRAPRRVRSRRLFCFLSRRS